MQVENVQNNAWFASAKICEAENVGRIGNEAECCAKLNHACATTMER